jgi:hypothetical protein
VLSIPEIEYRLPGMRRQVRNPDRGAARRAVYESTWSKADRQASASSVRPQAA